MGRASESKQRGGGPGRLTKRDRRAVVGTKAQLALRQGRLGWAPGRPSESLSSSCWPPSPATSGRLTARAIPMRSSPQPPPHRHTQIVCRRLANEGRGRQDNPNCRGRAPGEWETSARQVKPGPMDSDSDRNVSESVRRCSSRGDRAGSAGPQTAHPSLSQAPASLLKSAGSRPAPYCRAAQLTSAAASLAHSGRQRAAGQRESGQARRPQLTWTVHGRRARMTSRAHETLHAPSPPGSTPGQGQRLRRWGLRALALESAPGQRGCAGLPLRRRPPALPAAVRRVAALRAWRRRRRPRRRYVTGAAPSSSVSSRSCEPSHDASSCSRSDMTKPVGPNVTAHLSWPASIRSGAREERMTDTSQTIRHVTSRHERRRVKGTLTTRHERNELWPLS